MNGKVESMQGILSPEWEYVISKMDEADGNLEKALEKARKIVQEERGRVIKHENTRRDKEC